MVSSSAHEGVYHHVMSHELYKTGIEWDNADLYLQQSNKKATYQEHTLHIKSYIV
jgi:hypothetical protein